VDLVDQKITCVDCGTEFTFTVGEQLYYIDLGLRSSPKRCQNCRAERRRKKSRGTRLTQIICALCGNVGNVTFVPDKTKPVYCEECYEEVKYTKALAHSLSLRP